MPPMPFFHWHDYAITPDAASFSFYAIIIFSLPLFSSLCQHISLIFDIFDAAIISCRYFH
jgi:hypothetical protein